MSSVFRQFYIALLVIFAGIQFAFAQTRTMTVNDILNIKSVSDVQLAPDGSRVLYVVSEADFKENGFNTDVWMVNAQGGDPVKLTNGPKTDNTPRWSPDGKKVAFLSNRMEKTQIFLINPNGGEAEKMTDVKTSVSSFEWSPDGKRIAFIAPDTLSADEEKKQKDKDDATVVDKSFQMSHIWVIDVATKEMKRRTGGNFHVTSLSWSPDGEWIAFAAQPTPKVPDTFNQDIYIVPSDSGDMKKIIERDGFDTSPRFSPDGKWIAFTSQDGRKNDWASNSYLCLVAPGGGPVTNISKRFDETVGSYRWSPDGKMIYWQSTYKAGSHLFSVTVPGGEVKQVTTGDDYYTSFSFSKDFKQVAFLKQNPKTPPDVFVSDFPTMNPKQLTTINPQLKDFTFGETEEIFWKGKDGMEIQGILVKPVGYQPGKKYPLLVNVHGGPAGVHTKGFNIGYVYPTQVFAAEGYAILLPNPRGSGSFGENFRKANVKDWGGMDYQDIMLGVDYLIEKGIADKDKLGVMGWSYGGYMTSWVITQTNRFKAASVGAGVTNGFSFTSQCDIPEFMESYWGGYPWENMELYEQHFAMFHVKNVKTPTLIQHGEQDKRVPLPQGQELYIALKKLNVPVEFVIYPRQGHGLQEPKLLKHAMESNIAWMNKWIMGKEIVEKKEK